MQYIIITLVIISISLFVLSFFATDRLKEMENKIEQISLSNLQDNYQMKKKLKILEEELLLKPFDLKDHNQSKSSIEKQVESLFKKGYSVSEISEVTELSEYDVNTLFKQLGN